MARDLGCEDVARMVVGFRRIPAPDHALTSPERGSATAIAGAANSEEPVQSRAKPLRRADAILVSTRR